MTVFINIMALLLFYTDSAAQLIFLTLSQIVWPPIVLQFIYRKELTTHLLIMLTMNPIIVFLSISVLAIVIQYISSLHVKIRVYNAENIKLLDGMHEGLLILSKSNKRVMFCNKPS